MHLFRDEIIPEVETSDNEHHSESDKNYDPKIEKDIIDDHDSEERDVKEDDDLYVDTRNWLKTPHHVPQR